MGVTHLKCWFWQIKNEGIITIVRFLKKQNTKDLLCKILNLKIPQVPGESLHPMRVSRHGSDVWKHKFESSPGTLLIPATEEMG